MNELILAKSLRDAKSYEMKEIDQIIEDLLNASLNYEFYLDYLKDLYSKVLQYRSVSGLPTEQRILDAYRRNEFYCDIIYGPQGIGKSSYALRVSFYIYRDWRAVFLHLFHDPLRLLDFMLFLQEHGLRAPLVVIDDAGVLFGRHIYQLDKKRYMAMRMIFDLARAQTSAMLFTVPSHTELSHVFRIANVVVTKIMKRNELYRIAMKYRRDVLPSGLVKVEKLWAEQFVVKLPDNVYRLYTKLRNSYIKMMLELLQNR